ncbi:MAG: hypothetical protein P0120_21490 [Nitrospira sp.]|nr:hypothetical protein [Nitrospira sp.]
MLSSKSMWKKCADNAILYVNWYRSVILLMLLIAIAACSSPPFSVAVEQALKLISLRKNVHFVEFAANGTPRNPFEVARLIDSLKQKRPQRILILAFGWQHDRDEATEYYIKEVLLPALSDLRNKEAQSDLDDPSKWATICVSWDSKGTGLRKLLDDVVPQPGLTDVIATLPEYALLPLTYYAKATLADGLGPGALKTTLNMIFSNVYTDGTQPDLYLVGHSFGARVLTGLALDETRKNSRDESHSQKSVTGKIKGMVLVEPAMTWWELPGTFKDRSEVNYPIVVVQSRHDYANSFLFPLASIPANFILPRACHQLSHVIEAAR